MVRRPLVAALAGACLVVAGCGGAEKKEERGSGAAPADTRQATSVGPRIAGSVVQYADCGDWRRGSRPEREATVDELRDQLTAQGAADNASPLPDDRAYRILTKACAQDFASSLRLYKLFAKAQGFAPLGE